MEKIKSVSYKNVDITGGFWYKKQELNRKTVIHEVKNRYEEVGRFEAFRFLWKEGSEYKKPHYFWDSDVAKWMEAASYIISKNHDEILSQKLEELIGLTEKNQQEDGYFNIYHTVVEPENKFKNRNHHELYCFGHLLEAAVAYFEATGNDRFLNITEKYTDLIIKVFKEEKSADFLTPGHEEVELALFKAYNLTKKQKYLDLAMHFLNERGKHPEKENDPLLSWGNPNYNQSHLPVREQTEAFGHAVRACYLYCAMADGVYYTGDSELFSACEKLFDDITKRKMCITGGIGATHLGEAFTVPYDLPNDTSYNETCASISLSLFADRMKNLKPDGKYADIVEKEMYNGILSGVSLDGTSFFYENPLEINLADRSRNTATKEKDRFPITQRKKDFDCSCCPPNVARYLASVGGSLFSESEDAIYIHQYTASRATVGKTQIEVKTDYPLNGKVSVNIKNGKGKHLFVRVPGWCGEYNFDCDYILKNGYAETEILNDDFSLNFEFVMKPVFVLSNKRVRSNAGKVCVMYGPVVYCAESCDNDFLLFDAVVNTKKTPEVSYSEEFSLNTLTAFGTVTKDTEKNNKLYFDVNDAERKEVKINLVPYSCCENRGECDMAVWLRYI